ncbi:MAG: hypothetical protein V4580_16460 [Bacteroidota bacterium]
MNNQQLDSNLDLLKQITKVEASPFLITRIQQKINNTYYTKLSPRLAFGLSASFILLVVLNIAVIAMYHNNTKQEPNLVQSMNLMPHNSLYR